MLWYMYPQREDDGAGEGDPLTLVCTDVEGSTELWEWDNSAMMTVCCPPCCRLACRETWWKGPKADLKVPQPWAVGVMCWAVVVMWWASSHGTTGSSAGGFQVLACVSPLDARLCRLSLHTTEPCAASWCSTTATRSAQRETPSWWAFHTPEDAGGLVYSRAAGESLIGTLFNDLSHGCAHDAAWCQGGNYSPVASPSGVPAGS